MNYWLRASQPTGSFLSLSQNASGVKAEHFIFNQRDSFCHKWRHIRSNFLLCKIILPKMITKLNRATLIFKILFGDRIFRKKFHTECKFAELRSACGSWKIHPSSVYTGFTKIPIDSLTWSCGRKIGGWKITTLPKIVYRSKLQLLK
jgi:hypothetical protein